MIIYSLEDINKIEKNIDLFSINLNSFLEFYTQIEKNDKYEPMFSLTDKYKSFPINSSKSTKNFFQNNKWKIDQSNKINQNLQLSLNKLSPLNYNKIKNEIFDILINNDSIFPCFMKEMFEKIWFDEKFIDLYVNLCYDLSNNDKINYNLNDIILSCKDEFKNRTDYKKIYLNSDSEELLFINKRKIIGTIEFIGNLYVKEYLDNTVINEVISELFDSDICDLDYESFYKLWIIINNNNRLHDESIIKYKNIIKHNIQSITNNRIKILLNTLIEQMNLNNSYNNVEYINKCIIDFKKTKNIKEIIDKLKKLDNDIVINELIMNELENKENLFIEVILLLTERDELKNKIDSIDLDELEIDIPNIRITYNNLKKKLEL